MKANYHTHTYRCCHAMGTEREYIERAIEGGIQILGFSDHTPYPFSNGHESGFRVKLLDLDSYVTTLLKLREEYKDQIEIHIGFEAEYYPKEFPGLMELLKPYPIEYLILGQHINGNEYDVMGSGWGYNGDPSTDPEKLKTYVDQSVEALSTGCFTYFAHPDLINFVGDPAIYQQEMRRLCKAAKQMDIPLEINFLGLCDGRNYPNPLFWHIAGEEGCKAVFGADAHNKEAVWNPRGLARAERIAMAHSLPVVETVDLIHPVHAWEQYCERKLR